MGPSASDYVKEQLSSPRRATAFLMTAMKNKKGRPASKRSSSAGAVLERPQKAQRSWDSRRHTLKFVLFCVCCAAPITSEL